MPFDAFSCFIALARPARALLEKRSECRPCVERTDLSVQAPRSLPLRITLAEAALKSIHHTEEGPFSEL